MRCLTRSHVDRPARIVGAAVCVTLAQRVGQADRVIGAVATLYVRVFLCGALAQSLNVEVQ